jgi:hypothetical protein
LDPKALHYREVGFRDTRIECAKCGLDKKGLLPPGDEKLQRRLFGMAKRRLERHSTTKGVPQNTGQFWNHWPEWCCAAIGIYAIWIRDDKLALILLLGFVVMSRLRGLNQSITATHNNQMATIAAIHNQLTYALRLMQHSHTMDFHLEAVMEDDLEAADIIHDYEVAAGVADEGDAARLDNVYYAFVHWLEAGLRSIGCDNAIIFEERIALRDEIEEATKKDRHVPGNP